MQYNLYAYCFNNPVMNSDPTGFVVTPANVIGAIIGGIMGAISGKYLSNWLADKIKLKGWKRTAFVWSLSALVAAAGATIGYFVGPYIAGLWDRIKGQIYNMCFVKGTLIATENGDVPIEEIKEGDMVYSENPETGQRGLKRVVQTFINQTDELIHFTVNDQKISTTKEHPFWVVNEGWITAENLLVGDKLKLLNDEIAIISGIEIEVLEEPIDVYNFEVEDWHTYFVSSNQILVHNACGMSLNKLNDSYIKNTLKLNAHAIKIEYLGKNAKIALYDLAVDKKTKIIYIIDKAGKIVTETFYKAK